MIRSVLAACLLLCASCASTSRSTFQSSNDRSTHLAFTAGTRSLEEVDWAPLDEQTSFGVEWAHEKPNSMFGFEFGLQIASDDGRVLGIDTEVNTDEVSAGLRKTLGDPESGMRPYIGAGIALLDQEVSALGLSISDDTFAPYAHVGVNFDITESLFVGVDLRSVFGAEFGDFVTDPSGDYVQFGITLGFGF